MPEENNDLISNESSLDDFEEEFLQQQKSAMKRNIFIFIAVIILLGVGGYVAWEFWRPEKEVIKEPEMPTMAMETPAEEIETVSKPAEKETIKAQTSIILERLKRYQQQETTEVMGISHVLQVGIFAEKENADTQIVRLKKLMLNPSTAQTTIPVSRVRVLAGHYPFREVATDAAEDLLNMGFQPKVQITGPGVYSLVVGTFKSELRARQLLKDLEFKGIEARLDKKTERSPATIVLLREIPDKAELERVQGLLERANIKYVVRK